MRNEGADKRFVEPVTGLRLRHLGSEAARRAIARALLLDIIQDLAQRRGLTPAQAHVLEDCVRGFGPKAASRRRGISLNTYRVHRRELLRRCGVRRLRDVRDLVLRRVFDEDESED